MNSVIGMNHSNWGHRDLEPSPGLPIAEPFFYWWIEKRTRKGWRFVRDAHATKREIADLFIRFYGADDYRLRRLACFS